MYMCWVSILQKIWLVITYYRTSSASLQPQLQIGKIPSLALSRRCNIETNYGWNWKVTSLFRLDQTTAKRIKLRIEDTPKMLFIALSSLTSMALPVTSLSSRFKCFSTNGSSTKLWNEVVVLGCKQWSPITWHFFLIRFYVHISCFVKGRLSGF